MSLIFVTFDVTYLRRPIDLQNNTHRMECKASHFPILQSFSSLVEDVVTLNLLNETDFLLATTVSFSGKTLSSVKSEC